MVFEKYARDIYNQLSQDEFRVYFFMLAHNSFGCVFEKQREIGQALYKNKKPMLQPHVSRAIRGLLAYGLITKENKDGQPYYRLSHKYAERKSKSNEH